MAARRRGNGEGSIWRRTDGRWTGAIWMPTPDGGEKRVYRYGRTRTEVADKLTELRDKRRRGVPVARRSWKLADWLDYWLKHVIRPAKRWNTYAKYEQTARLYLKPMLGNKPLEKLRVATVQRFLNQQITAGHSIAKVQVMRMVLGAALTRAMREELVTINAAHLATLPPAPNHKSRPWNASESRRFLAAAHSDPLYPAFLLLLTYGLRRGEVLGLSWDDIDLAEDVIRVGWQIQRIDRKLRRVPVKTDAGNRELPLLPIARDVLIDHAGSQADTRRRNGIQHRDCGLVFTTRTGQPVEPRDLARSFQRITTAAGLRPIPLHGLRHTVATMLKDQKVSPRDAKQILGHARIAVTLEIYTDSDLPSQRSALDKIADELFPGPEDGS